MRTGGAAQLASTLTADRAHCPTRSRARAEGRSFSSGRDVSAIGGSQVDLSHHELMRRGHRGIQQLLDLDAPLIVAHRGWSIGASFQRALLCDIRVAAEDARFMLPEVAHG